jgi:DNA-binding NtrC family response regulator
MEPNRVADPSARILALVPRHAEGELERVVADAGLKLHRVPHARAFLEALDGAEGWRLALLSLGADGVDPTFLEAVGARADHRLPVAVCAPQMSLEGAIVARDLGSDTLLREPLGVGELDRLLRDRVEVGAGARLADAPATRGGSGLVAASASMAELLRRVADVGNTSRAVLLVGEAGTGKEMLARAIHDTGRRRVGPFITVNCAALPERLLELELFGHERGAVQGAAARRTGRIERAEGGTLFLAELRGLGPILQARLLRVFTEHSIERVGGSRAVPVDVRIVASTDEDLTDEVDRGAFRRDLWDRLSAVRLEVPPLRDRPEDVVPLALHFADRFAERYGRELDGISDEAVRLLETHAWPGNVLELRNVMDRAVVQARGRWIHALDLGLGSGPPRLSPRSAADAGYPPTRSLADVERDHIRKVLKYTNGAMGQAAEILGIHRNTLTRKVDQYGLREESDDEATE